MNIADMLARTFHPHDARFVFLSCSLAFLASYVSLEVAGRIRVSGGRVRVRWLALSGLTMGGGIWAMHFVAMLGVMLPFGVSYGLGLTALSFAIASVGAAAGVYIAFWRGRSWQAFAAGGLLMGCGVAAMHYVGMSAMRMPAMMAYHPDLVALSVVIAVFASTAALWLAASVRSFWQRIASAVVMAFAIVAMHFTGMAAFVLEVADGVQTAPGVRPLIIGDAVVGISMLVLLSGLGLVYRDKATQWMSQGKLAQFGLGAITTDDPLVVLSRAAAAVRAVLNVDIVMIIETTPDTAVVRAIDSNGTATIPGRFSLSGAGPIKHGCEDLFVFTALGSGESLPEALAGEGIVSGLVLPMLANSVNGLVCAFSREARRFKDDDVAFVRNIAEVLNVLWSRDLALKSLAQEIKKQTALADFSIKSFAADSVAARIDAAAHVACDVLGADRSLVVTVYLRQDMVVVAGSAHWPPGRPANRKLSDIPDDGLVPTTLRAGAAIRFADVPRAGHLVINSNILPADTKSGIAVPLEARDDSHVIFLVFSTTPRAFSDEDEEYLRTLANITAMLVERQQARDMIEGKMRTQLALTRFSSTALRSDNLNDLYTQAAEVMRSGLDMEYSGILEVDERADILADVVQTGWTFAVRPDYSLKKQPPTAFMPFLLRTKGVLTFPDMDSERRFDRNEVLDSFGVKSGIGLWVRAANGRILVLTAFSTRVRYVFKDAEEFMQTLANMLTSLYDRHRVQDTLNLRDRALASISQGITISDESDADKAIIYSNPAFARMIGYPAKDVAGVPWVKFLADDAPSGLHETLALASAKKRGASLETRLRRRDGTAFTDHVSLSPIFNADGNLAHYVAVHEDVTEDRRRDQQIHDAQKMEAVGQLTGGIAHDFNNLLTVVKANAEDMREELKSSPLLHKQCSLILRAADRGGDLVRQLMAFARKQELEPKVVDLNAVLDGFTKLVRRTLPENIKLDIRKAPTAPPVKVDPGRLENALLNLVLNARDAMPQGGEVIIETSTAVIDSYYACENPGVRPGLYVLVAVSDSGCGMTRDVQERAFQPFFTTKEVGQGTGLGLSMVYGFVRQSGGHAKIYSEVNRGTTIKIYLPPAEGAVAPQAAEQGAAPLNAASGSILVVEDDDLVRQSVCNSLERLGYSLTSVESAALALAALERNPNVDLIFTDVIMPGAMTGADLAREVQRRWPAARLLMTSGYTESSVLGKVKIPEGIRLLSKPYSNVELADAIRTALQN